MFFFFLHPIPDFQIVVSRPLMESVFIQLLDDV